MTRFLILCSLFSGMFASAAPSFAPHLESLSLSALEQKLQDIDAELNRIAFFSLRSGIGAIGNRSQTYDSAANTEWVQIELGHNRSIDTIMLVPTIWRDVQKGFVDDGFPLEFRILAGQKNDPHGSVIAHHTSSEGILPRIAPFIISCPDTVAAWVRIEALKLSPRHLDEKYLFQLAEIFIFDGQENVALHQPVAASSPSNAYSRNWQHQFLVDGFTPYLMNAAEGNKSLPFVSDFLESPHPTFTIDLKRTRPISRIHLHTIDQSDTVPQGTAGDFGFPRKFRIEGAIQSDFSDAVPLLAYAAPTVYQVGPMMMWNVPETTCRYIRMIIDEPFTFDRPRKGRSKIGLAEIELFSKGQNVALKQPVQTDLIPTDPARTINALTDGNNLYGKILPIREWLEELSRRHDLEACRPDVLSELNIRYAQQKKNLQRMSGLAVALTAGIIITILIDRLLRQRTVYQLRQRIAANLHDELGANLYAIGLLNDLAKKSVNSKDALIEIVDKSRNLTAQTAASARYYTNMLEAKNLYEDLPEEMKRTAHLLLDDFKYQLTFRNEHLLSRLSARKRIDLFLFYKECLMNINRHSNASEVWITLSMEEQQMMLSICDNGEGLKDIQHNPIPKSLTRRARLLRSTVSVETPDDGGTNITLQLKMKSRTWKKVSCENRWTLI